jgi:hypothetical protein
MPAWPTTRLPRPAPATPTPKAAPPTPPRSPASRCRTIRRWARAEGWPRRLAVAAQQDPAKTEAHAQAARIGWQTRRRRVGEQLGELAVQLLEAISRDLAQRKRLNLPDAGILLGIVLDKAEALAAGSGKGVPVDEGQQLDRVKGFLADLMPKLQERERRNGGRPA